MDIVTKLAQSLDKDTTTITNFLSNASYKYKVYAIPKRKQGRRIIAQPSKVLKIYQRAFLDCYTLPTHSCAMAYKKGKGIKENALAHCRQPYLLKMDFEKFFNSITPMLLWQTWDTLLPSLSAAEKQLAEQLLFWCPSRKQHGKLVLSVGAPSSPTLSNFCLYFFDQELTRYCQKKAIIYTRYADDLTFSTHLRYALFDLPLLVKKLLVQHFKHQLLINYSKTVFSSKAHNRHVTGITINNEGRLSLGRKRKRYIKHLVKKFHDDQLFKDDIQYLQGLLAFAKHIEPGFIIALQNKYTATVIQQIFKVRV